MVTRHKLGLLLLGQPFAPGPLTMALLVLTGDPYIRRMVDEELLRYMRSKPERIVDWFLSALPGDGRIQWVELVDWMRGDPDVLQGDGRTYIFSRLDGLLIGSLPEQPGPLVEIIEALYHAGVVDLSGSQALTRYYLKRPNRASRTIQRFLGRVYLSRTVRGAAPRMPTVRAVPVPSGRGRAPVVSVIWFG